MAIAFRQSLNILRVVRTQNAFHRNITMSAKLRAKEAIQELKEKNPYYEKYASKIAALQQTSPEEFLNRVESIEKSKKLPKATEKERNYSELLSPKPTLSGQLSDDGSVKKLDDIMKVDLLQDKSAEEVKEIWLQYHKQKKEVLVATIPSSTFTLLSERSKKYPLFILPLPRSQGFEFFLLQFSGNSVHFTPLLCYQVHKENAPECLNIVHYTELSEKLEIVLMRGEYNENVLSAQEAQCLVNELQLYYSQNNQSKLDLLEKFTSDPDSFEHMDVINELQNLTIE